jgi:quercetin dioxygenase-like cupin family protein
MLKRVYVALFACLFASPLASVAQMPTGYAQATASKFVNLPVIPSCMTVSVQEGDPAKTAIILLAKFKAGCDVPWHWHTANERLLIVSGVGRAEMKGAPKPLSLKAGDYILMPGKGIHRFSAITNVELFLLSDAAFDIHYVDPAGKEIPVDAALKPAAKPAAAH